MNNYEFMNMIYLKCRLINEEWSGLRNNEHLSSSIVKVKLDNIHACTVDEPIAFAIPVQYSANWATWQLRAVRAVVS